MIPDADESMSADSASSSSHTLEDEGRFYHFCDNYLLLCHIFMPAC